MSAEAYRIRIRSDGAAWRKGAWILYRHSFSDITGAREAAQAQARTGRLVRVTTATSVRALAEFDGRAPVAELPDELADPVDGEGGSDCD